MGGAVRVEGDDCRTVDGVDNLPLVVGYDGGAGDTGALVAGVREVKDRYEFAADTVRSCRRPVRQGERALVEGDVEEVGRLMNFNHGLLSALGSPCARSTAWSGPLATPTRLGETDGRGGGGCIVAPDESEGRSDRAQLYAGL